MNRFNLNAFFALDAILHSKTLTEAAASVHLSQPAMSVSLKKLRSYFNDELVVYMNNNVQLTPLAEALKPRIREVLRAARNALELKLEFDPATDARQVHFTAPDVIELTYLGKLFTQIAARAPNMQCLATPFKYLPVSKLFLQPLDIAIVSEVFIEPEFASMHLFTETLSCMVCKGNTTVRDSLTEDAFFGGRHAAVYHTPERVSHPVGAALNAMDRDRNIVLRASVYSSLPQMIMGTDLIVTTLTSYAQMCAQMLPLRVYPCPIPVPPMRFYAQWQKYRDTEPLIQWIVKQMKTAASELN